MSINLDNLASALRAGIVTVVFEKIDGSTRTMRATLSPDLLPPAPAASATGKVKTPNPDVFTLYSVDDKGWRSFRKELFISAEIAE